MIRTAINHALLALLFFCTAAAAQNETADALLAGQRSLFLQTRAQLQRGVVDTEALTALRDYPLYPYLQLIQLTSALEQRGTEEIDNFLAQQGDSVTGDQLRSQWLALLANNGRWNDYLRYYRATDAGKLQQCWNLEALYRTGQQQLALQETGKLWLTTDLPDACDEPFKRWLGSAQRSEPLVWQRLLLALERKQETLARFLTVQIGEPYKLQAEYALLLFRDPTALNDMLPQIIQHPEASAVLALGLKNLARRDADGATALWQQLKAGSLLTGEDNNAVRREIGRQQISSYGVAALPWLQLYDANGEDSYLAEWRVRLALPGGDWAQIARWIDAFPLELAQSSRWTYWRARALGARGDEQGKQQAQDLFNTLAKERSFYGFLAADILQTPYQLNEQRLFESKALDTIALRPAVLRAREFYQLGELTNARREWQYGLRSMSNAEQQSAALLASQWNWHDQAIRTANQSRVINDLRLRFPIGYRDEMTQASATTTLPLPWLFAITRQESAFMYDARSPVGALGLMQLMPDTARQVARGLRSKISNDQLLQPEVNIRLGSTYLSGLAQRYRGNRILATAAYNAGPNRISNLLKRQESPLRADVWVETLPYRETREYVQNVLAFAVIYGQRLGVPTTLLNNAEREIGAPAASGQ